MWIVDRSMYLAPDLVLAIMLGRVSHLMWSVGPHRAQSHSLGSPGSTLSTSR